MGCNTSTSTAVVSPIVIKSKEGSSLMYSQLVKELVDRMNETERKHVMSYCSDIYTDDYLLDSITMDSDLYNLTNYMRDKIEDDNPLCSMGRLMIEMGSYNRAEHFYLKTLPVENENWMRRSAILNNLGKIYHDQDKLDEALEYYEKSVKLQCEHVPEDHPSLSADYSNIGTVYQKQKRYDLALEYFQRALNIEMKSPKPDEELIALFNNNIGLIYNDRKEFSQGLIYHEKCLQMNEKLLPSTHPSLALSHHNLAISLFPLGRFNEARLHAQKAIDITSHSLPDGHPQRSAHKQLLNAIEKRMR